MKLEAMLTLLLLKRNITNNLRTRRMVSELLEMSKQLEDSFTTHQWLPSMPKRKLQPNLLPRRKKNQKKQSKGLHLNLTKRRKNP